MYRLHQKSLSNFDAMCETTAAAGSCEQALLTNIRVLYNTSHQRTIFNKILKYVPDRIENLYVIKGLYLKMK